MLVFWDDLRETLLVSLQEFCTYCRNTELNYNNNKYVGELFIAQNGTV